MIKGKEGVGCVECPLLGKCKDGTIVSCRGNFILSNYKCIEDTKQTALVDTYFKAIATHLSKQKGYNSCY